MKTLNLDQLKKVNRTVTLGGKTYEVLDMTVAQFIESTDAAERLKDEKDPTKQLKEALEMVHRAMPSCPKEILGQLNLDQLNTLLEFINGGMDEEAKTAADTGKTEPVATAAT